MQKKSNRLSVWQLACIRNWWNAKSQVFSRLCATEEGEEFTHGDVVKGNLYALVLIILIGVAGWLGGSAL